MVKEIYLNIHMQISHYVFQYFLRVKFNDNSYENLLIQ